jgi:hypothetical protein
MLGTAVLDGGQDGRPTVARCLNRQTGFSAVFFEETDLSPVGVAATEK